MAQRPELRTPVKGEGKQELNETGLEPHPLSLLFSIADREGRALPPNFLTVANLMNFIKERAGVQPLEISVLNDKEVLVEFDKETPIAEIAGRLNGIEIWGETQVEIGSFVSNRVSLLNMSRERNDKEWQQEEFHRQVRELRRDQEGYQSQLVEVVHSLQDKLETLEQESQQVLGVGVDPVVATGGSLWPKVRKPPELPYFSGTDPVPREEGSFEQWIFQVRGSSANHTKDAIRSGVINSVRGEARDLVEYIGFTAPLETLLTKLEERFKKARSTDRLQYEFFQLSQDKGEGVQQYAGRLENQYKKLKLAFPHRYGDAQLKERLFFGMVAGLRNATRYVYKQTEATYEILLTAAKEAELEFNENRGVSARMKAVGVTEKGDPSKIQELQSKVEKLAATLKANQVQKGKVKSASAPNSPMKRPPGTGVTQTYRGPEVTSQGPFRGGRRPIQCYKCGGWGHGWKDCPSPGNVDWRRWKRDNPPPATKEVPENTSS